MIPGDKISFIQKVAMPAVEDWQERHICLPSLIIALAIDGTDWGQSDGFLSRREMFPNRRDDGDESCSTLNKAVFSHNNYLTVWRGENQKEPNWKHLIGQKNYILAVQYLQTAEYPYSSEEGYEAKLINLIEKYKLMRFEEMPCSFWLGGSFQSIHG